jgi:hypothetical protein
MLGKSEMKRSAYVKEKLEGCCEALSHPARLRFM